MIDLFYDHFLAINWLTYTDVPLRIFTGRVYSALTTAHYPLPDKLRLMMPYMIRDDWLQSYTEVKNIGRALAGLAKRRNVGDLAAGLDDLNKHYKELEADFTAYFPELIAFVAEAV
jgi:acyl carrier protein phosphodiesterase